MSRLFAPALLLWFALPAPAAPTVVVATVAGDPLRGGVATLDEHWQLRLDGQSKALSSSAWLGWRRADARLPGPPAELHLVLTGGDCLPATGLTLTNDTLSFRSPWCGDQAARLSLERLALVWRTAPDGVADEAVYRRRLLTTPRRRDVVVLRNGDVLEGVLTGLDDKGVDISVNRQAVRLDSTRYAVIALGTAAAARPKGLHGRLVLDDGSRFSLRAATCTDGKTLAGTTVQGLTLTAPLERVVALDLLNGAAVYLSELKPADYEHTSYLGVSWPLAVDASVAGSDLRLAGSVYERGLGLHSAARVRYTLPEGARRFEALVGLDDRTGRRGDVRLRVQVDGKDRALPDKGRRSFDTGPLALSVDVAGGRELTLIVDFGGGGDVSDHVNWADARVIR